MGKFVEAFASVEFWLNSAILIALARFLWGIVGRLTDKLLFALSLRTQSVEFTFEALPDRPKEIMALRCLFVRYGNDQYLRELASDQEKHHGRLRNQIRPVVVEEQEDGRVRISFTIRIHRRLGTQFKLFLDVEGETAPVEEYLARHPNVYDISKSSRPDMMRVFFLIRDFAETTTVDGFKNNIIWPV